MAKAETKRPASRPAAAKKAKPVRTHDITVGVGASIVIDPAGERLYIRSIDEDHITFEQDHEDSPHTA